MIYCNVRYVWALITSFLLIGAITAISSQITYIPTDSFANQKNQNATNYYSRLSEPDNTFYFGRSLDHVMDEFQIGVSSNAIVLDQKENEIIEGRQFDNQSLVIINSPGVIVRSNTISSLSGGGLISAIYLLNSPDAVIENNHIQDITSSNHTAVGISIIDSTNVKVFQNTISDVSSGSATSNEIGTVGILTLGTSHVEVSENTITRISGFAPFGILSTVGRENQIIGNTISEVEADATSSESAGIVVDQTISSSVRDNDIDSISAIGNNFSTSFGITIHESVEIEIAGNNIDSITSLSIDPNSFGIHATVAIDLDIRNNQLLKIDSQTPNYFEGYSTGIYLAFVNHTIITANEIGEVSNIGRATYGYFIDQSFNITSSGNTLEDLVSHSQLTTLSSAITVRDSPYFSSEGDIIDLVSSEITAKSEGLIASSIGIILDFSENSTVNNVIMTNLEATANFATEDAVGILVFGSDNTVISNNLLYQLSSKFSSNGISIALSLNTADDLTISHNSIQQVLSAGSSYGIFQAGLDNSYFAGNVIRSVSAGDQTYGHYMLTSHNIVVDGHQLLQLKGKLTIGVQFSLSTNIHINSSQLIDTDHFGDSRGIYATGGTGHQISGNTINNKTFWLEILSDDVGITCDNNNVNGHLTHTCDQFSFEPLEYVQETDTTTSVSNEGLTSSSIVGIWLFVVIVVVPITSTVVRPKVSAYLRRKLA